MKRLSKLGLTFMVCFLMVLIPVKAASYTISGKALPVYKGAYYGKIEYTASLKYDSSTGSVYDAGSFKIDKYSCNTMGGGTSCRMTPTYKGKGITANKAAAFYRVNVDWYFLSGVGYVYMETEVYDITVSSPGPRTAETGQLKLIDSYVDPLKKMND